MHDGPGGVPGLDDIVKDPLHLPTPLVRRKHAPLTERLVHALAEGTVQVQEQLHHYLSHTHTHKMHTKHTPQHTQQHTRRARGIRQGVGCREENSQYRGNKT
jgi:peptidoglycan/xylan/chitin deacetylase (PgdA/CDA1 family)